MPAQYSSGYGPKLSAVISELSGSHGASRQTVADFCRSVLGLPISTGGIQALDNLTPDEVYYNFPHPFAEAA